MTSIAADLSRPAIASLVHLHSAPAWHATASRVAPQAQEEERETKQIAGTPAVPGGATEPRPSDAAAAQDALRFNMLCLNCPPPRDHPEQSTTSMSSLAYGQGPVDWSANTVTHSKERPLGTLHGVNTLCKPTIAPAGAPTNPRQVGPQSPPHNPCLLPTKHYQQQVVSCRAGMGTTAGCSGGL